MDFDKFCDVGLRALEEARQIAERRLGRDLSSNILVKLYGAGSAGDVISPDRFLEKIYIDQLNFYRLIDVAVIEVYRDKVVVFCRVSDHPPGAWNMSYGGINGPFKQLIAANITQHE